jgi:gamma-glutamyltranspeptidase
MWRRALASEGTDVFYTGEIAEKIVGHLQKNGGIMTMEDMAACVAVAVAVTQRLLLSVPQGDTVQLYSP